MKSNLWRIGGDVGEWSGVGQCCHDKGIIVATAGVAWRLHERDIQCVVCSRRQKQITFEQLQKGRFELIQLELPEAADIGIVTVRVKGIVVVLGCEHTGDQNQSVHAERVDYECSVLVPNPNHVDCSQQDRLGTDGGVLHDVPQVGGQHYRRQLQAPEAQDVRRNALIRHAGD